MGEFDSAEYEAQQGREFRRIAGQLRAFPEFRAALDQWGRGPAIMLLCPRGHDLLPVIVSDPADHRGRLGIGTVPYHYARADRYIATPDEPWRTGSQVCSESGCPQIIDYSGWCSQHGGRRLNELGTVRTAFHCQVNGCSDRVPVRTARLLMLYGAAIKLGRREIPIGDTPTTR